MKQLRKNRRWYWMAILAAMLFSLPVLAEEPILIGVVHRQDFAYAAMMRTAFEMALEVVNSTGERNERTFALAFANDRGDPKAGVSAIRELVLEKNAVLLVGGYSSSNTLEMAYAANGLRTPFLVCTAADDRITQHNLKYIFRLNPPVREYTKGLEQLLLAEVKPATMSIVYENSPFGTGIAMRMMWFCRENDIEIKAIQPYQKKGATSDSVQRVLLPIQKNPPEVLFLASYLKDAILLVNKISEMEINALLCGGAGGFTHADFPRKTGKASQYLLTATLWSPSESAAQETSFRQQFMKRHGEKPDYHAVEAYSALLVAASALRESPSLDADDIRAALEKTNIETPFGEVAFTDYGPFQRQNVSNTPVFQVINGQFETVWPKKLATTAFVAPSR